MKIAPTASMLVALTLIAPVMALASPKKAAAPTMYQCSKCHMRVSAAIAKKDHYRDPMDGGTLVPMKPAPKAAMHKSPAKSAKSKRSTMNSMGM